MYIKRLTMSNYRGIESLDLELDRRLVVLIGENGTGKSTILGCVRDLCENFLGIVIENVFRNLPETDKKNEEVNAEIAFLIDVKSENLWLSISSDRSRSLALSTETNQAINRLRRPLKEKKDESFPLFIFYPVYRLVNNLSLRRINPKQDLSPTKKMYHAVKEADTFASFFDWFKYIEDLEKEERQVDEQYRDSRLERTRQAVYPLLIHFAQLRFRSHLSTLTIQKGNIEISFNQLSDGEKCIIAMIGDIARQLTIANPSLDNPLEGEAIIMIDEIELHLHPKWQRGLLPYLLKTFPNCQFIVTTHSPQVVSDVKPEQIVLMKMEEDGRITANSVEESYGRDSNYILEVLMNGSSRPLEIQQDLDRLFEDIANGNLESARELHSVVSQKIGENDPDLRRASVSLRRKESLRK